MKPAMGHHFDAKLICLGCQIPWAAHQALPERCKKLSNRNQKPSKKRHAA